MGGHLEEGSSGFGATQQGTSLAGSKSPRKDLAASPPSPSSSSHVLFWPLLFLIPFSALGSKSVSSRRVGFQEEVVTELAPGVQENLSVTLETFRSV